MKTKARRVLEAIGEYKTTVSTDANGITRVVLHSTAIVEFDDNRVILRNGDWPTSVTKTRMNQASREYDLGFEVFQKSGEWFVKTRSGTIPFTDGMEIER